MRDDQPFAVRAVIECGWNLFRRRGYSEEAQDIALNPSFLEQVAAAGLNWVIVFWSNGPGFEVAWSEAAALARRLGVRLARAVYGFSAGGPEHSMAEPKAPEELLRASRRGPRTALCPHEPAARDWLRAQLARRLQPEISGLLFEPAREIRRNCSCERCSVLSPAEWDAFILDFLARATRELRPDTLVLAHINQQDGALAAGDLAQALRARAVPLDYVCAWGVDTPEEISRWLDADPRFVHYARLGRYLLFPGDRAAGPVEQRVAAVFAGCRQSAERGKAAYVFDYRMFGGAEFGRRAPMTRSFQRLPASLALSGAALANPSASAGEQQALLARWRKECEWDLDDPAAFYLGDEERTAS